jgi:TonB family protein
MKTKITLKFLLILIIAFAVGINQSQAQEKQIIRLNQHFYPIDETDSLYYFHKAILVDLTDSTSIERIFNLKNQIVKVTRYGYNDEGGFPEVNMETYDSDGKLYSKKIRNQKNGFFQAVYFNENEQLGKVLFQGDQNYEIRKAGSTEVVIAEENLFEPKPRMDKDVWTKTLKNNLKYPSRARHNGVEGTVILAIFVNEFGERGELEVANPENVNESLALEALRAALKYDGEITPATTIDGNTIDAWLYIPLAFKLD